MRDRVYLEPLFRELIEAGYSLTVLDCEDVEVLKESQNLKQALDSVCHCDVEYLLLHKNGKYKGSVLLVHGNGPDENPADWTADADFSWIIEKHLDNMDRAANVDSALPEDIVIRLLSERFSASYKNDPGEWVPLKSLVKQYLSYAEEANPPETLLEGARDYIRSRIENGLLS